LAALVNLINEERPDHVLTVEDPIEYVHKSKKAVVNQRQAGKHTGSFGNALRGALREDPDVIVIGELRDLETISLAITAAETGHLVLATVHTPSAVQTVDRMLDAFPAEERNDARGRLAACLQGVISQALVDKDGGGRVAAVEVLVVTEAIRSCIREGKTHQIRSQMQTGGAHGMQTQAAALAELVRRGLVAEEAALAVAGNPEELRNQLASGGVNLRAAARPAAASAAPRRPPTAPVPEAGERPAAEPPAPAPARPLAASQELLARLRRG
jgi:twitching motility protein PilT